MYRKSFEGNKLFVKIVKNNFRIIIILCRALIDNVFNKNCIKYYNVRLFNKKITNELINQFTKIKNYIKLLKVLFLFLQIG